MRSTTSRKSTAQKNRTAPAPGTRSRRLDLTLEELVAIVRCIVPESEVAATVCALFDRGIASFNRPLQLAERGDLAKAG